MIKLNWSSGLSRSLNDANNHIISSNEAVVISDKYPKAQFHFLCLPKQEDISSLFELRAKHLPLLEEMHLLALNIIEVMHMQPEEFRIGFHTVPSMELVHMHIISQDFNSNYMKTKKHWNSFNTRLFRPYEDVRKELSENGYVKVWDADEVAILSASDLACNQCDFISRNMPKLKEHLLQHWNERQTS